MLEAWECIRRRSARRAETVWARGTGQHALRALRRATEAVKRSRTDARQSKIDTEKAITVAGGGAGVFSTKKAAFCVERCVRLAAASAWARDGGTNGNGDRRSVSRGVYDKASDVIA